MNESVNILDSKFRKKAMKVLKLAVPAMIAIVITFGYVLVNIAYAGKL